MGVPHRDDMTRVTARRPDHDDHAAARPTRRDVSVLAVIDPVVEAGCNLAGERRVSSRLAGSKLIRIGEVDARSAHVNRHRCSE